MRAEVLPELFTAEPTACHPGPSMWQAAVSTGYIHARKNRQAGTQRQASSSQVSTPGPLLQGTGPTFLRSALVGAAAGADRAGGGRCARKCKCRPLPSCPFPCARIFLSDR